MPRTQKTLKDTRFGSRAWARALVQTGSARQGSGRVALSEGAPTDDERSSSRRHGRHRLLPCAVLLSTAGGSQELFPPSPFDEFRCVQRRVEGTSDLEYLTRRDAGDRGRESYRPFGCFDLSRPGAPLPQLSLARDLWVRLRKNHDLRALPRPRLTGELYREGLIQLAPGFGSGRYKRDGEQVSRLARTLDALRAECTPVQWIAWFESAFDRPPPGWVLHRYYLDGDLNAYLVRDHWRDGKTLRAARGATGNPGLWIHTARRAA